MENRYELNKELAQMLKGGVIMDVTTPEQAKIAEAAGACAVMALERIPADIRAAGGVSRMSDPKMIQGIQNAVTIPVMAKCRIGHFVEAQVLEAIEIDYIDESEVLSPADDVYHINKKNFKVPFVCGAKDLGEALRRMTDPGIYGYTMTGTAYNAAVTGWFERRFGWKPEEDWLVTTPGVVYAICTAIRAFTEPGEAVVCLLPVYSHFFTAVEDNGRRPVYGHLKRENGHYEIDFEELERLLDEERPRLLILCSPHNPVGRVWKREELERLGRLCFL